MPPADPVVSPRLYQTLVDRWHGLQRVRHRVATSIRRQGGCTRCPSAPANGWETELPEPRTQRFDRYEDSRVGRTDATMPTVIIRKISGHVRCQHPIDEQPI